MEKMDLGQGCTARLDGRTLVISYLSREACRADVGEMDEKPLRLLASFMALAYLCGRRDGGLEMCREMTRTVDEIARDLPSGS